MACLANPTETTDSRQTANVCNGSKADSRPEVSGLGGKLPLAVRPIADVGVTISVLRTPLDAQQLLAA